MAKRGSPPLIRTKKLYCTQNDHDCLTCDLAKYGRDCRNNRIMKRTYLGPVEPFRLLHPRLSAFIENVVFMLAFFGGIIIVASAVVYVKQCCQDMGTLFKLMGE